MSRIRRLPCSPAAAAPLEHDDLLSEILLRLHPQPSTLPRASLVCKQWRSLVSDPGSIRRFRLRHRRHPPLLGCFVEEDRGLSFVPTLEAPNRVPPQRFSLQLDAGDKFLPLGCRHGLVLFLVAWGKQVLVWDPVTGDQHRIAVPDGFGKTAIHGAVLRAAGDAQHFQVVLVEADNKDKQRRRALACLYSSETGVWGDLVSTPSSHPIYIRRVKQAMLIGDSLYWLLGGSFNGVLEFGLVRQNLTMIPAPVDVYVADKHWDFMVMRAEGGGLGFFVLLDFTAQLWKRTTDDDGVASWALGRTFELDKLLSLNSKEEGIVWILGFAEHNYVFFVRTRTGLFMIHLDSLQFK